MRRALVPLLSPLLAGRVVAQCASTECLAGVCVDAAPGAAELGALASCAAAATAASLNCAATMNTLDPSLPSSVSLGAVCARTCGWCANPVEFVNVESLGRQYCSAHTPPTCVAAPGSGATGCQGDDGAFSATHPVVGKTQCEAVANCVYAPGTKSPPAADCVVHPFSLTTGEMSWIIEFGSPATATVLRAQDLDGEAACSVTKEELMMAGLSIGAASQFVDDRETLFKQVMPTLREHAMTVQVPSVRRKTKSFLRCHYYTLKPRAFARTGSGQTHRIV
jgi:hypothetical protein